MAQKWNLQDIVPPDRARRGTARDSRGEAPAVRQNPPREMRMRRVDSIQEPREPMRATRSTAFTRASEERDAEPALIYDEEAVARDYVEKTDAVSVPQRDQYESMDSVVARLEVTDGRLARVRRAIYVGVVVALLGFVGFGVTVMMSGAEVTVKPKSHSTTIQASFEAALQPQSGALGYDLLTLEEEGERQVAASGKSEVNEKAKGDITVYNAYSATPQKLVKSTRFEGPGGLIYRASEGITIPGYTKDAAGNPKPGSVKVTVVADGAGENYNLKDARLTIPGLKGTDQYEGMYAEADKSVGISGGFTGTKYVIDENELATVKQKLHMELRDKLLSRIKTERPNGFLVYEPAITFVYDALPSSDAGENTAVIKERARLMVPLFNEVSLASYLARHAIPGYSGEPIRLKDPMALTYAYEGNPLEDISKSEVIRFTLAGGAEFIWKFDAEALKKDLLGAPKADLPSILPKYPSIEKAKAVVRPIWKRSFPSNGDDIKITEVDVMN